MPAPSRVSSSTLFLWPTWKNKKSPIGGYCINHSTVSLVVLLEDSFLVDFYSLSIDHLNKSSTLSPSVAYNPRNGPLTTVWSGRATVSWSRRLVICLDTILLYDLFSYTTCPSPEWTAIAIGLRFSSSFRLSPLSFASSTSSRPLLTASILDLL